MSIVVDWNVSALMSFLVLDCLQTKNILSTNYHLGSLLGPRPNQS